MGSNDLILSKPDKEQLMALANACFDNAQALVIDSPMMFELAGVELMELTGKYKELEEKRLKITRPMDEAKKNVMALFKPALERMEQGVGILKGAMLTYQTAEKKKAQAAQAILDEAARKERTRVQSEQREQEEQARQQQKLAADLNAAGQCEDAAQAAAKGETAQIMAATLESTAIVISAPVVESEARKVSGISFSGTWKAKVTDKAALLKYLSENPAYLDWVDVKLAPLHGMAKAQKGAMRIPGVEAYEEANISARRA